MRYTDSGERSKRGFLIPLEMRIRIGSDGTSWFSFPVKSVTREQ